MATVKFYLHRPTKDGVRREDECSITLVFTAPGCRFPIYTGEKVAPKHWNKNQQEVKPSFRGHIEINGHLSELKQRVLQVWRDNKGATAESLKGLVREAVKGEDQPSLTEDPTQKKTSLFTVGRFLVQCSKELDSSTVKRYAVLWRTLSRFLNGKRLDLSRMDMTFHDGFKNFLYDTPNPNYTGHHLQYDSRHSFYLVCPGSVPGNTIGLFDETVFKYIVQFKTFCDWAAARGYKVDPSYKTWEVIKREYPPISITKQELEAIEHLPRLGNHPIRCFQVIPDFIQVRFPQVVPFDCPDGCTG